VPFPIKCLLTIRQTGFIQQTLVTFQAAENDHIRNSRKDHPSDLPNSHRRGFKKIMSSTKMNNRLIENLNAEVVEHISKMNVCKAKINELKAKIAAEEAKGNKADELQKSMRDQEDIHERELHEKADKQDILTGLAAADSSSDSS
jgi:hypothetical protein